MPLHNLNLMIRFFTEPYAILLFCGVLWLIVDSCRKRKLSAISRILLGYLGFNILWLLFFGQMRSVRYAMTLFVPGLLCAGHFFERIRRKDMLRLGRHGIAPHLIFTALLAGLVLFSVSKFFRKQPISLTTVGKELTQLVPPGKQAILLCNKESRRLQYYSGIETEEFFTPEKASASETLQLLENRFFFHCYHRDEVLAALILHNSEAEELTSLLREKASPLKIARELSFRKRTGESILLLQGTAPTGELSSEWLPEPLLNGDFSEVLPEEPLRETRRNFVERGILSFRDDAVRLPTNWFLYTDDPDARAYLSDSESRLHLFTRQNIQLYYFKEIPCGPDALLCFSASGRAEKITVSLYVESVGWPYRVSEIVPQPQMQEYRVPLSYRYLVPGDIARLMIHVYEGEADIDNIRLFRRTRAVTPSSPTPKDSKL